MLREVIPVQRGLFTLPDRPGEKPRLLGSRCRPCGEAFFPKRKLCRKCGESSLEDVLLGPLGRLYTFTRVFSSPPGYFGPVPYLIGEVELEEGERVLAQLVDVDLADLKVGMRMELVLTKVRGDELGNDIVGYAFRPASM